MYPCFGCICRYHQHVCNHVIDVGLKMNESLYVRVEVSILFSNKNSGAANRSTTIVPCLDWTVDATTQWITQQTLPILNLIQNIIMDLKVSAYFQSCHCGCMMEPKSAVTCDDINFRHSIVKENWNASININLIKLPWTKHDSCLVHGNLTWWD